MSSSPNIATMSAQERFNHLVNVFIETKTIWILKDEVGAVMMVAQEEDCIPVWSNKVDAQNWAKEEWEGCEPMSISLADWETKWTDGMAEDELMLVICPDDKEEGLVISPFELEEALNKKR
ncbi:DUF2750 domain-containing protein [Flocculibacter collagenilyticus]|uniref:DUF2750 domain-containing protein n=1 Tax=Flocculibacter collagenilyticus TaxID=2744479 RepID=UPI0018F5DD06|nr:DUF2750 domain-containing protein [Flocculibacter collagenilyticus]